MVFDPNVAKYAFVAPVIIARGKVFEHIKYGLSSFSRQKVRKRCGHFVILSQPYVALYHKYMIRLNNLSQIRYSDGNTSSKRQRNRVPGEINWLMQYSNQGHSF